MVFPTAWLYESCGSAFNFKLANKGAVETFGCDVTSCSTSGNFYLLPHQQWLT